LSINGVTEQNPARLLCRKAAI